MLSLAVTICAAAVLVHNLFSERLSLWSMPAPLVATAIGIGVGPYGLDLLPFDQLEAIRQPLLEDGSRLALAVGLVGVALRLPHGYWRANWRWLLAIVGIGMVVMWLSAAALLLTGLPLLMALLIGAMLAPTDPITTTPVVTGANAEKYIPSRVRLNLSGESGINDGLGFLFVMLPLLLMTTQSDGHAWREWLVNVLLWQNLAAVLIAAALGWSLAKIYEFSEHRNLIEYSDSLALAIPVGLLTLGLLSVLGTNGILGVFVAAAVFGQMVRSSEEAEQDTVVESVTRLVMIALFVLLGIYLPFGDWGAMSPLLLTVLAGAVFVRRFVAVWAVAPLAKGVHSRSELLFISWFGPIGVSALYYAMHAVGMTENPDAFTYVSFAILASVVIHGLSTAPFSSWLGRRESARLTEEKTG